MVVVRPGDGKIAPFHWGSGVAFKLFTATTAKAAGMTAKMASKHSKNTGTKEDNLLMGTKPFTLFVVIYLKNFRGGSCGRTVAGNWTIHGDLDRHLHYYLAIAFI